MTDTVAARDLPRRRAVCKSVPVRVATLNLLPGVPLRDRVRRPAASGGIDAAGAANDPGPSGRGPNTPDDAAPADTGEAHGPHHGVDPMERHIWSPDVSDPTDLLRAVAELEQDGPLDVLALQEVDRHQPRTGMLDQAGVVAEQLGARWWRFVPSVHGTPGIASEGASWVPATAADDLPEDQGEPPRVTDMGPRYGVALLSRWPVRRWRVKRFPPAPVSLPLIAPTTGRPKAVRVPDEPRSAVAAIIEIPHADITVATAHLTFVPGYNTRQLAELRAFLAGMPRPLVLLGDFNLPGGIPGLVTGWQQIVRVPTYPVARPRVQFDHILADGWAPDAVALARASARAMPVAVSDHCAVLADFPDPAWTAPPGSAPTPDAPADSQA